MTSTNQQSITILQKLVLKNPILHLFNTVISKFPLANQLSNHFSSIFLKSIPSSWQKFLVLFGATALTVSTTLYLRKLYIMASIYARHHLNVSKSTAKALKEKYGDCWVAITGFTEGIGWALTNQLLKLEMKVVLIGRNKEKIDKRVTFLKEKFENPQIQVLTGDLSKSEDINNICEQLKALTLRLDVGILINNAGLAGGGEFFKSSPQSILNISQTNWTSVVRINSAIIPHMKSRPQHSAIINFSSCTGKFISPHLSNYPASKRMINVYSEYLRQQLKANKIDVMTVMPFGVSTPMMQMTKNYATITPDNCARSVISDLIGGHLQTYGGVKHKLFGSFFESITQKIAAQRFETYWKKFT